ncbi:acyl-CoA dehydrogenase [Roseobacter cerasinus]|uniref:Acyl-CoA dehydrogenase n=1 Tax=Roseobacter cerasinus TaxID=2602289 RepID=A0A640VK05_9RHOB|nr:acyl-CoA dehydrogenase family protein [Roseobacter cerasinus]GFE48788.1 acyl-CoA dehydrogenase [Roseobacter cerasinus]
MNYFSGQAGNSIEATLPFSILETVKRHCQENLNPFKAEWEKAGQAPLHEIFKDLATYKLLGIQKDVKVGGQGMSYQTHLEFAEALGHCTCPSINLAVGVQTDIATPALAKYGSTELVDNFLKPSINGDLVACMGASEPGAGSDLSHCSTKAVIEGDDLVINGSKMWTTNGAQADWMCLLCQTNNKHPILNKALICVPLHTKGVVRSQKLKKIGFKASDTTMFFFDDVRVPARFIIGNNKRGLIYQMEAFQEERLWVSATGLVPMERSLNTVVEYLSSRPGRKNPELDFQHKLFEASLLSAEIATLRAALKTATGSDFPSIASNSVVSRLKLQAGRLQRRVFNWCCKVLPVNHPDWLTCHQHLLDCRLVSIAGGSDEVMMSFIGKELLKNSTQA